MAETFTEAEVYDLLRDVISDFGSQKAFAKAAGVSTAYVNDVVQGRRAIAGRLLIALGFERRVVFVSVANSIQPHRPAEPEGDAGLPSQPERT